MSAEPTPQTYSGDVSVAGVKLSSLVLSPEGRKQNAAILAAGYTAGKRRFEVFGMTLFLVMQIALSYVTIKNFGDRVVLIAIGGYLALVGNDIVSGHLHWIFDTWGRLDTPVIGPTFIRSFREHHIDPTAMTHHDFIQTNSDSCWPSTILNGACIFFGANPNSSLSCLVFSFFMFAGPISAFGNEIHKWTHQSKPVWWVKLLMKLRLVNSRKHHGVHHKAPFDKFYCITWGFCDPFLEYIDYWRRMEQLVTALTGAVPRSDDKLWTGQLSYNRKRLGKTPPPTAK